MCTCLCRVMAAPTLMMQLLCITRGSAAVKACPGGMNRGTLRQKLGQEQQQQQRRGPQGRPAMALRNALTAPARRASRRLAAAAGNVATGSYSPRQQPRSGRPMAPPPCASTVRFG